MLLRSNLPGPESPKVSKSSCNQDTRTFPQAYAPLMARLDLRVHTSDVPISVTQVTLLDRLNRSGTHRPRIDNAVIFDPIMGVARVLPVTNGWLESDTAVGRLSKPP